MGPVVVSKKRRQKQYKSGGAVNGVGGQRRVFESYGNKRQREAAEFREQLAQLQK